MLKAPKLKSVLLTALITGWLPLAILAQKPPAPPAAPGTPPADAPKAAGQEPAPGQGEDEEDVITLGTELLQLYVSVTDKQGRPVNNLKREHFVLREDGKPQDIAFFSVVTNGALAADPEAGTEPGDRLRPPAVTPEGRYFALVVDDLHIAPGNFLFLRNALLNFVEKNIVEGDHLLVLSTSGTLGFLQQMTDDRRIMRLAIERLTPRNEAIDQGSFGFGFTMTDYEAFLVERNDRQTIDFLTQLYLRSSPGMQPNQAETIVRASARSLAQRTEYLTTSTLETIRSAALALGNYPGRKTLLLATDGFINDEFNRNGRFRIQRVLDAATRAGVTVYSIHSAGLEVAAGFDASQPGRFDPTGIGLSLASQARQARQDAFRELAAATGGLTFVNTNDLSGAFSRAVADASTYYALAYYPDKKPDGRFHKIEVKLNLPGSFTIRTQQGFFSPSEKDLQKAAEKKKKQDARLNPEALAAREVKAALGAPVPPRDIPLRLASTFVSNDLETSFSLAFPLKDIAFRDVKGRKSNTLTMGFVVFDLNGKALMAQEDTITLNILPERLPLAQTRWGSQIKSLKLAPGMYNVRAAIYDPITEHRGAVNRWIEIPNVSKAGMMLSDIIFLQVAQPTATEPGDSQPVAGQALPPNLVPINQAVRRYPAGAQLVFVVTAHNVPKGKPTAGKSNLAFQTQIFKGEEAVYVSPLQRTQSPPNPDGTLTYAGQVSLEGLAAGQYRLKLVAYEETTKKTAVQSQDFTIH